MTSNLGGEIIKEFRGKDHEKMESAVWEILHKQFRPEFLNRLDSVVIYNSLSPKDILRITEQQLEKVKERMLENNITLKINDELALYFAEIGYDPVFGARPLRRAIEEKLVDEIAMRIIEGKIKPRDIISPKVENDQIII